MARGPRFRRAAGGVAHLTQSAPLTESIPPPPNPPPPHRLAGVGVRVKKLVGPVAVKVYACGFYCDKKAAAKRLAKFKGEKGGSKKLFDAVEAEAFDKIILLKMARKVYCGALTRPYPAQTPHHNQPTHDTHTHTHTHTHTPRRWAPTSW